MSDEDLKIRIGAELKEIKSALKNLRNDIKDTGSSIEKEFEKSSRSSRVFSDSLGSIRSRIAGLVSGAALLGLTRQFVKLTDDAKSLEAQIRLVTDSEEELKQTQTELAQLADDTRSSLRETTTLYARLARSSKEYGATQEQLLVVTKAINQATRISGGDRASSEAAITQLTQALASGVLRGQELNSVLEQAPRLAEAIAKGMRIPFSQLRKDAEKGKITTDQIINALIDRSEVLAKEFEKLPQRTDEAIQGVNNALLGIFSEGDTSALTEALNQLKETLQDPAVKQGILDIASALIRLTGAATSAISTITQAVKLDAQDLAAGLNDEVSGLASEVQSLERYIARLENLKDSSVIGRSALVFDDGFKEQTGFDTFEYFSDDEIEEALNKLQKKLADKQLALKLNINTSANQEEAEAYVEAIGRIADARAKLQSGVISQDEANSIIARAQDIVDYFDKRYELSKLTAESEEKIAKTQSKLEKLKPIESPELQADENLLRIDEIQRRIALLEKEKLATTAEVNRNYKERFELQSQLLQAQIEAKKASLETANTDNQRVKILTDIKTLERDILQIKNEEAAKTQEAIVDSLQDRMDKAIEDLRFAEESLQARKDLGDLSELEAETAILAARDRHIATLSSIRAELKAIAEETKDPAVLNMLDQLSLKMDLAKLSTEQLKEALKELSKDALADAFTDILTGVKSVEEAFKQMLREIANFIIRQAAIKAAASLFSSGSGTGVEVNHSGGIAGNGKVMRIVPPFIFDYAPRYHSGGVAGLKPNEVPAVLERGEEILTQSDPRHRNNIGKGNTSAYKIVNVVDPSLIDEHMTSERGEEIILNVLRRNGIQV